MTPEALDRAVKEIKDNELRYQAHEIAPNLWEESLALINSDAYLSTYDNDRKTQVAHFNITYKEENIDIEIRHSEKYYSYPEEISISVYGDELAVLTRNSTNSDIGLRHNQYGAFFHDSYRKVIEAKEVVDYLKENLPAPTQPSSTASEISA